MGARRLGATPIPSANRLRRWRSLTASWRGSLGSGSSRRPVGVSSSMAAQSGAVREVVVGLAGKAVENGVSICARMQPASGRRPRRPSSPVRWSADSLHSCDSGTMCPVSCLSGVPSSGLARPGLMRALT